MNSWVAEQGSFLLPAHGEFVVADRLQIGTRYGELVVTYLGPTFWRLFGGTVIGARQARQGRLLGLREWASDETVEPVIGHRGADSPTIADLVSVIGLGAEGPGRFDGESNTFYAESDGRVWTPHFYTRGNRLGFGALPFGDSVGWEPGDVFIGGSATSG